MFGCLALGAGKIPQNGRRQQEKSATDVDNPASDEFRPTDGAVTIPATVAIVEVRNALAASKRRRIADESPTDETTDIRQNPATTLRDQQRSNPMAEELRAYRGTYIEPTNAHPARQRSKLEARSTHSGSVRSQLWIYFLRAGIFSVNTPTTPISFANLDKAKRQPPLQRELPSPMCRQVTFV
jgi:hypothetical protein